MSFNPDKQRWTNEDAEDEDHLMAGFDSSASDGEGQEETEEADDKHRRPQTEEDQTRFEVLPTAARATGASADNRGGAAGPSFFVLSAADRESLRRSEAFGRALRPAPMPKAFSALEMEQLATVWIVDRAPGSSSSTQRPRPGHTSS